MIYRERMGKSNSRRYVICHCDVSGDALAQPSSGKSEEEIAHTPKLAQISCIAIYTFPIAASHEMPWTHSAIRFE